MGVPYRVSLYLAETSPCHPRLLQVGLQGVDNGALRFTSVRLPRTNLLDRFATVDRSGKYSSPYSPSRRFAATLGELTGGRVGLTCSSVGVLKVSTGPGSMQNCSAGGIA